MHKSRTIFITGVAGGVGRVAAEVLSKRGYPIIGLARPEDDISKVSMFLRTLVRGYIEDASLLEEVISDVDVIVNCAALLPNAIASVDRSVFNRVNVKGAETVMRLATEYDVKELFFFSTISVADHIEKHVTAETMEEYIAGPHDPYLESKIDMEKMLKGMAPKFSGPVHVIRPAFIYGPGNFATWSDGLELVKKGKMCLIGDGSMRLPLIHARDIAEFIAFALNAEHKKQGVQLHVLSNPEPTTMAQVFDFIAEYLNVSRPKRLPYFAVRLAAELVGLLPSQLLLGRFKLLTKARLRQYSKGYDLSGVDLAPLGFTPTIGFRAGMPEMVDDYFEKRIAPIPTVRA